MNDRYLLPAGTINNRTAQFYAKNVSENIFGPIVKQIHDQILVIIDYTVLLTGLGKTIDTWEFTSDAESNPPLIVSDPLLDATGRFFSFLVSLGITGQQYDLSIDLTFSDSSTHSDTLTINIPSSSDCKCDLPPIANLIESHSCICQFIKFTWGPTPPPNPSILDQWYNTTNNTLYEWIYNGTNFLWEQISAIGGSGGGGTFPDAPVDDIIYGREDHSWMEVPIQTDVITDGINYVRNDQEWIPDPLQNDAPNDGFLYGRKSETWSSDGEFTGDITVDGTFKLTGSEFTFQQDTTTGATIAIDRSLGEMHRVAVSQNVSLSIVNWYPSGVMAKVVLDITNMGNYTLTWPSAPNMVWANGFVPTLTPNGRDIYMIISYDGGATYQATIIGQNYS